MERRFLLGSSILGAALMSAGLANADVDAQQIWEEWKALGASMGQTISGTESFSGGTLTVSDVSVVIDSEEANIVGKIDQVTLTEQNDGSVVIEMSPQYPFDIAIDPEFGETAKISAIMSHTDLKIVASGDADETVYDFSASDLKMTFNEVLVEDEPMEFDIDVSLVAPKGAYVVKKGDLTTANAKFSGDAMSVIMSIVDPENGTTMDMNVQVADLASDGDYVIPEAQTTADFAALLKAGFAVVGGYTYGATSYTMNVDENGSTMNIVGSAAGGGVDFDIGGDTLSYGGAAKDMNIVINGSQIPLQDVTIKMSDAESRLVMPVSQSEEPSGFGLRLNMKDLSVSEQIWGLFDPAAVLPRDPATLVIDVAGKARLLNDIFDPEAMAQITESPFEPHSVDINDIQLSVAGAELTGSGAFTFDTTDTVTFDGMPKPTGSFGMKLTGGNGLMDKLVQMGLLPQDQVMGFRMMLGLFARPGEGEDTLVSEIEVTEDGQVLANGQRLR